MTKINALVLEGAGSPDVAIWLRSFCGASIVTTLEEANLVFFTGGHDVTPSIYGERNVASGCDWMRDMHETEIFNYCRGADVPMAGICRGSQFLHTQMQGKLWQDVTGHANSTKHPLVDLDTGETIAATTSTHHQMVRMAWTNHLSAQSNGFELFGKPPEPLSKHYRCADTTFFWSADGRLMGDRTQLSLDELASGIVEVEGYRYPDARIMAFQGHPEWGPTEYSRWAGNKLRDWHAAIGPQDDAGIPIRAYNLEGQPLGA